MPRLLLLPLLLLALLFLGACRDQGGTAEMARLQSQIDQLKAATPAAATVPELGQQMLELQIRHARLWQAGAARNWMLTQFQLAELRESLDAVSELNGDHAALQPNRLADVLPETMGPALKQMQGAIDAMDGPGFDAAYDAVSEACTACHTGSDHGFLVIQRPQTPMLDNLRAAPAPAAAP